MRFFIIDKVIQEKGLDVYNLHNYGREEEFDGPAISALGVRSRKLSNVRNGQS
jgi:hypothetical protein